jgi:hypothetical protein
LTGWWLRLTSGSLILLLLAATAALPAVKVESYDETRFDEFTTYAWIQGTPARREQIERTIRASVELELESRGLQQVDEGADLLVATHASPEGTAGLDPKAFVYGGAPWKGWTDHGPIQGALLVDLVDGKSQRLLWRGLSTGKVPASTEKAEKKVVKLIRKMFREFPPDP